MGSAQHQNILVVPWYALPQRALLNLITKSFKIFHPTSPWDPSYPKIRNDRNAEMPHLYSVACHGQVLPQTSSELWHMVFTSNRLVKAPCGIEANRADSAFNLSGVKVSNGVSNGVPTGAPHGFSKAWRKVSRLGFSHGPNLEGLQIHWLSQVPKPRLSRSSRWNS